MLLETKKKKVEETHVLARFEDGRVSNLPRSNVLLIEELELRIGQDRTVKWSDGKKYKAKILFIGERQSGRDAGVLIDTVLTNLWQ